MTTYITSDLHFGHANILRYCPTYRGRFASVEEMDAALLAEWTSLVRPNDEIFFLGDMTFYRDPDRIRQLLGSLTGRIRWVTGNHDHSDTKGIAQTFPNISLHEYLEIKHNKMKVCLFHFPIESWHSMHYGSCHMHGHTHGTGKPYDGRRMDVGWDCFGRILTMDEAVDMLKVRNIELSGDHHAPRNL